jgi:hypothetical protein
MGIANPDRVTMPNLSNALAAIAPRPGQKGMTSKNGCGFAGANSLSVVVRLLDNVRGGNSENLLLKVIG